VYHRLLQQANVSSRPSQTTKETPPSTSDLGSRSVSDHASHSVSDHASHSCSGHETEEWEDSRESIPDSEDASHVGGDSNDGWTSLTSSQGEAMTRGSTSDECVDEKLGLSLDEMKPVGKCVC
jgi:hypothetical protein